MITSAESTEILTTLAAKQVPQRIPDMEQDLSDALDSDILPFFRKELTQVHRMWGLVDLSWTAALARELGSLRVLEVMAGSGWLAKALQTHGVSIIATDGFLSHNTEPKFGVFPVEHLTAVSAIETHPADALLMCWPPYGTPEAWGAARAWGTTRPIYLIGEMYGCTASEAFWDKFAITNEWSWQPNLPGLHSRIYKGYWT